MTDDAQFNKEASVHFVRIMPGPIERVWEVLVNTQLLPGWYGVGYIEPRQGGAISLMDGHIRGVVTQCFPPDKISYTWNVFDVGQERSSFPESYLTLELEAREKSVLLTLNHLPILVQYEKQNAMGWHTYLDMLEAALSGETVEARPHYMKINAARYGIDLANLAR